MPTGGSFQRWASHARAGRTRGRATRTAVPQGLADLWLPDVTHSEKAGSGQACLRSYDERSARQEVRWRLAGNAPSGFLNLLIR